MGILLVIVGGVMEMTVKKMEAVEIKVQILLELMQIGIMTLAPPTTLPVS
jgi:hypothetical protein